MSTTHSAADYLSMKDAKPEYIVTPIIPRGRVILCVGNSTVGKTPFGYQLARDISAGNSVLDYFPCVGPSNVGLFDAESTEQDIALRLKMQEYRKADTSRLHIWNSQELHQGGLDLTTSGRERILSVVEREELALLLLDNLHALSGGIDVSKGHLLQPILRGLRRVTSLAHHPSVVLFHHPRKGARDDNNRPSILSADFMRWLEEASGSYLLVNLTDVRLGLERVQLHGEELTVFRGRSRVAGEEQDIGPLYLTIDEEHSLAEIDRRPQVLEDAGPKIKAVLDALRGAGRFDRKQAKVIGARLNTSSKTALRAFEFGRAHGFIEEVEPGMFEWSSNGT